MPHLFAAVFIMFSTKSPNERFSKLAIIVNLNHMGSKKINTQNPKFSILSVNKKTKNQYQKKLFYYLYRKILKKLPYYQQIHFGFLLLHLQ